MAPPMLVVISGPPGAGKTTLAHALSARVGGPAICRDEIKEGLVATLGHDPSEEDHDRLNRRSRDVFFALLTELVGAGVSSIAEAAYQDRLWQPGLAPLLGSSRIALIRCRLDPELARVRREARRLNDPSRRAHQDGAVGVADPERFGWPQLAVPTLDLSTDDEPEVSTELAAAFVLNVRNSTS